MLGRFIKYIQHGIEDDIVELKAFSPLDKAFGGNVIKEILAMANTGHQGFILFGVHDAANRHQGREAVPGMADNKGDDQIQREINALVASFTEPPVRVRFSSYQHNEYKKKIGVVTVLRSDHRPHQARKNGDSDLRQGSYYIRHGTSTDILTPAEIREMASAPPKRHIVLLNFSHSFTERQIRQLEDTTGCLVEHAWPDCKIDLDARRAFGPQVQSIVDDLGYSPEEWQDAGRFIVSLPGFAEASAVLLAELHGRMGQFPTIVRRRSQGESHTVSEYVVEEVVNLSEVRAHARQDGAHLGVE